VNGKQNEPPFSVAPEVPSHGSDYFWRFFVRGSAYDFLICTLLLEIFVMRDVGIGPTRAGALDVVGK
jgi:hypothetical protein